MNPEKKMIDCRRSFFSMEGIKNPFIEDAHGDSSPPLIADRCCHSCGTRLAIAPQMSLEGWKSGYCLACRLPKRCSNMPLCVTVGYVLVDTADSLLRPLWTKGPVYIDQERAEQVAKEDKTKRLMLKCVHVLVAGDTCFMLPSESMTTLDLTTCR